MSWDRAEYEWKVTRAIRSEEGVALPLILIVLLLFASLIAVLSALSRTEPQITANLVQGTQVLNLADAGIQQGIWALNNATSGLTNPLPNPVPAPYNGSQLITLGAGGYTLAVSTGASTNERNVTATGWIPNNTAPRAKKILTVTLMSLAGRMNPPAALTAKGQVQASGTSSIDASATAGAPTSTVSACPAGAKLGAFTASTVSLSGTASIYGGDGNLTPNQTTDYSQNQAASALTPVTFTQAELNALKALAKANGSYYQGTQSFTSALPTGIVFVDTVSGNPIGNPPTASDLASVTLSGTTSSSGWLIVMGAVTVSGGATYTGLVYAADDLVLSGGSKIVGAAVTQNVLNSVSNAVDGTSGSSKITYDCNAINTGVATGGLGSPTVPQGFSLKPGTWQEVSG